jgi:oligoendopeptidase F
MVNNDTDEMQWNLGEVIPDANEERLKTIAKRNLEIIQKFLTKYTPFLERQTLQPNEINQLLEEMEELTIEVGDLITYGHLAFAANTSLSINQLALHLALESNTKMEKLTKRFQHKINEFLVANPSFLKEQSLDIYRPYLDKELQKFKYQLDLQTEELLLEKDRHGIQALMELRDKWLNNQEFPVKIENKSQYISYGKIMGLLHDPHEKKREAAIDSLYTQIERDQEVYLTAFRSICNNSVWISKKRNFKDPIEQSLILNNVEREPIESLMETMEKKVDLYQRYLKLKAKQLKIPVLRGSDLFAPPKTDFPQKYPWKQAKQIILETYYACDQELGEIVQEMFDSHHIDALVRQGKTNGAFCHPWLKGKSAYVLQSYNGNLNDIYTLAHELGHAVHGYLILRTQKLLNSEPGAIVAETAAKFGELILTDYLLEHAKTKAEKINVLMEILDFNGYSMFWGSLRFWFEKSIYEAIERKEFLTGDIINEYYIVARDKSYGKAVEWPDKMEWEWAVTPHYYITDLRFYNYPYIFALIFVYNCFQEYKTNKTEFLPKFKAVLEAGGSKSLQEIASHLGFDITDPSFWEKGLQQYSKYTDEFESLIQ